METFKEYRSVPQENWIETFVYQLIQRGVQEAATKYNAKDLHGEKRGEFQAEVDKTVKDAFANNALTLKRSTVDEIHLNPDIMASIEEEVRAKQAVKTARQQKEQAEVENERDIEKEEAQAKAVRIKADAEAEANRKLSQSITPELVSYLEAEARQKHGWFKYKNTEPTVIEKENDSN